MSEKLVGKPHPHGCCYMYVTIFIFRMGIARTADFWYCTYIKMFKWHFMWSLSSNYYKSPTNQLIHLGVEVHEKNIYRNII